MAEQISKRTYHLLKLLPHPVLKFLKLNSRHYRFKKALKQGRLCFKQYGRFYPNHILFVAGLPKSGTTWLENMLSAFSGYTIIPDPEITKWGYARGESHSFELSMKYFENIEDSLSLVKVHCHGSQNNVNILKQLNIPYCIMYRDLRDAAVSYVFYVKRTPWHPEFPLYKNMDIKSGLKHFGNTFLSEWKDWIVEWIKNRDKSCSMVIKYEDLVTNTVNVFRDVVSLYNLPEENLEEIVQSHQFPKTKKKGNFFRKGRTGDWKNHFDDEIKLIFKSRIADFLIQEGYEKDSGW